MKKNAEDGGTRRFIMVQLPEACAKDSEAFKAGYKTIAEVSKERIRRAGKKISEGNSRVDTGFRVLKIDTSNMADVYYTPDAMTQDGLFAAVDNIKPDRSAFDLLFQVMLDWGARLRKAGLIEGRKPKYYVSASVAKATASVADYIRTRGQDDAFYLKLITDYLTLKSEASRAEINQLLLAKLSDALSDKQKANKISTLLTKLRRQGTIENTGSDTASRWQLAKKSQ